MDKNLEKKARVLFEEKHTRVERLFSICVQMESRSLTDFLDDIDIDDLRELFPSKSEKVLNEYDGYRVELFIDNNMEGYIAECEYNVMDNFSFREDGSFSSCSNTCYFIPFYVYADTMEELLDKVLKKDDELFENDMNKARKKQGIVLNNE